MSKIVSIESYLKDSSQTPAILGCLSEYEIYEDKLLPATVATFNTQKEKLYQSQNLDMIRFVEERKAALQTEKVVLIPELKGPTRTLTPDRMAGFINASIIFFGVFSLGLLIAVLLLVFPK